VDDRFWIRFRSSMSTMPLAACRAVAATFIAREHLDARTRCARLRASATILYPSFPR
jgi:hypothetical protein